jgi:hypothetical protein
MGNDHIFIALIHHPVYDRKKEVVTTSITNLDIHDLARLAKTFGLGSFYIVQPIISHWERGAGAVYNETRRVAFETIRMVPDVREMIRDVEDRTGVGARLVATTGKERPGQIDFGQAKKMLKDGTSSIILFGTGWGLADDLIESSDLVLEPIAISDDYNHLSVRCAAAIILDRLLGK